ncbi:MAG TPA: penicillin acylase family protein [Candidatus Dormibacteraeota bacterium]|jgi:penicillin amidase|nr:penicillin acylase family protein [Candidatus Dormibacteraeota bacterium]
MALILAGLAGAIAALALLVGVIYLVIFRRPLPRTRGSMPAAVSAVVEIVRDEAGVPHVTAASWADASYAVGVLHGQERLWQMELQRRIAAGRLSEVIGERAIPADRLFRRLGLRRVSEAEWHVTHAAGELRPLLEAYAMGVNAAIGDRPLPAEFTMLRHRPEPWTPEDSLAVGRLLSFGQSGNWEAQLVRMRLLKDIGPELLAALDPSVSEPAAANVPPAPAAAAVTALLDELQAAEDILELSTWAGASNSWALAGSRTATGRPILASDPHSVITMPSPWYQVHLTIADDAELAGVSFCGSPFVVAGHNRYLAWGLVNSGVSIQGLYVERFNPNNPMQFDDGGHWEDAVRFREVIRVRGGEPVTEDVLVTRRGPVISPAIDGNHPPLSLRWVGTDSEIDSHGWVMRLNRARDWRSFRAAVGTMASPSLAVTYADVEGNIGYRMSGFIPLRPPEQGRFPARGWEPGDEWRGFVPFEEMPEVLNPADGYIVAANIPMPAPSCPHPLVHEAANPYRAQRIEAVVAAGQEMTVAACVELQCDVLSLPGQALRAVLLDRLDRRDRDRVPDGDPDVGLGTRVMRDWDGALERDSAGALLYERLWERLMERVVGAGISPGARAYLLGGSVHDLFPQGPFNTRLTPLLIAMLERGQTAPLGGADPEARDRLLAQELAAAVVEIRAAHGDDPRRWRWGAVHKTRFEHPLASVVRALAPILSRGPFDSRGDNDTVWLSWKGTTSGILAPVTSAFWRAVYDTADWAASLGGFAPGESGHPGSGHYADMVEDWLQGRPRQLLFGAQPAAGDRFVLRPEAPPPAATPPPGDAS